MKKILLFIYIFLICVSKINANNDNISNLFTKYLEEVCKIEIPPKNQTYIIIDLLGCPSCVKKYVSEVEKIYDNKKKLPNISLIVVGNSKNNPAWLNRISKSNKKIYYDGMGAYHEMDITSNESGIVIVKNNQIVEKTIIQLNNYKIIFKNIKCN